MAKANFDVIMKQVLGIEGGIADRPLKDDPGGLTNLGVTQKLYDLWRTKQNLPLKSVREITSQQAVAIGRSEFWNPIQGDKLPSGVDFAVFDYAFNSGVAQAVKDLQRVLGVVVDGIVGIATLEALAVTEHGMVIDQYMARRWAFMTKLRNFGANKNGWKARVDHVRSQSLSMVANEPVADVPEVLMSIQVAKANPQQRAVTKFKGVWAAIAAPFVAAWVLIKDVIMSVPEFSRTVIATVGDLAEKSPWALPLIHAIGFAGVAAGAYVAWSKIRATKEGH